MRKRVIVFGIMLLLLALGLGFFLWANDSLQPMPEALLALQSDNLVQVEQGRWIAFSPVDQDPRLGVIFYPGGKVDPRAYAPPMRQLAENGYLAVIVPMPLNLAVFAPGRASDVIAAYPEIESWVIGGHSLGGTMAANFVNKNALLIDGVFFWASYPAGSDDLSALSTPALSIYASLDGLVALEEIEASRLMLPAEARFTRIEGGNHAQFGWYGDQPGDNIAEISRESQQEQVLLAMIAWMKEIQP